MALGRPLEGATHGGKAPLGPVLALFQIQVALVFLELLLLSDVLPHALFIQADGAHPIALRFLANSAVPFRLLAPSAPSSVSAPSRCPPRLSSTTSHPRLTLSGVRGVCPGPGGFVLHTVTRLHRPPLLSTTRGSATLCLLPGQGSPFPGWLVGTLGNLEPQSRSASQGKARHLLVSRPASVRFVALRRISGLALPRLLAPLHTPI